MLPAKFQAACEHVQMFMLSVSDRFSQLMHLGECVTTAS